MILFGVDPEESLAGQEPPRRRLPRDDRSRRWTRDLYEHRADAEMVTDQWGTWLTAQAPVRDSTGKPVAAVGVDLSADRSGRRREELQHSGLGYPRRFARVRGAAVDAARPPGDQAARGAQGHAGKIGQGDLDAKVELRRRRRVQPGRRRAQHDGRGLRERHDAQGSAGEIPVAERRRPDRSTPARSPSCTATAGR